MKYEIEKNDLYYVLTPKEEKIDSVLAPTLKADLITYEVEGAKNIILDLKNVSLWIHQVLVQCLLEIELLEKKIVLLLYVM